jgi:hypothetical protein
MDGNKLFLFLQDKKSIIENYKTLANYGAKVTKSIYAEEIRQIVLNELF